MQGMQFVLHAFHSVTRNHPSVLVPVLLLLLCRYMLGVSLTHTAAQQTHHWMRLHAKPQMRQPQT
jgi:hypothetical protein